ncbi:MAG: ABC transporter ATP-binding protein [Firmicutes bacterium]|nr:ABC transporter ATP-binding protein [Bacillota bacterium]
MAILEIKSLTKVFGGLTALSGVNIEVGEGELIGLIGPNGAGKTTVFNLLTGIYAATSGEILLNGRPLNGLKPYQITRRGIARTFQNIRLFNELSVLDNVRIAYHRHVKSSMLASVLRLPGFSREERELKAKALELLEIFHLTGRKDQLARNLSYGEQRRLEIVRALATGPQLLLLDEPAAGMNPQETNELVQLVRWLRERFGLTIILIEHDMGLVMQLCERIYVLDYGLVIAEGAPETIKRDPRVIQAYLGEEAS